MKIASLLCFIFISVGSIFAQEIDDRLLSKYSQEELQTMIDTDVDQYHMLAYALDNALYLANYDSSKGGSFETISVDLNALPSFIELGIEVTDRNQYFKIEGEEKLLVVKSAIVLKYEMKKK
ncbi:MAG: hypothetical protein P8P74_12390 [Crocinitomicaceae bacterium]|nr:hypothetical protein [Crocinitomicaceae bacterium]